MRYRDREDAGRQLAGAVAARLGERGADLVLGIPRGGVVVAAPVAETLDAALDVAVARKLGAPHQPELAIGAVAPTGPAVLNRPLIARLRVGEDALEAALEMARAEARRREDLYRGGRDPADYEGQRIVVVDDGIATGATVIAVARMVRAAGARTLVIAVPVAPPETLVELATEADAVVCPLAPRGFRAVGEWYDDFAQVGDAEVIAALGGAGPAVGPAR